jgi:hypothetical protein
VSDQFRSIAPLDCEAHKAALASMLASFRSDLPQDYVEFLTNWDGGEGFFGDDYVAIDGPVLALGTNFAHAKFANPIQFIGSDGGGEGKQFQIVMAPSIGTDDHATWRPMASSFTDLISGNFSPEFRDRFSDDKA